MQTFSKRNRISVFEPYNIKVKDFEKESTSLKLTKQLSHHTLKVKVILR